MSTSRSPNDSPAPTPKAGPLTPTPTPRASAPTADEIDAMIDRDLEAFNQKVRAGIIKP
ncbi:MAG: hypothetical protein JSU08_16495 [Acidobacteria bacterium]|nr:hypothetical protein [Acidobacteriota bacterium]